MPCVILLLHSEKFESNHTVSTADMCMVGVAQGKEALDSMAKEVQGLATKQEGLSQWEMMMMQQMQQQMQAQMAKAACDKLMDHMMLMSAFA